MKKLKWVASGGMYMYKCCYNYYRDGLGKEIISRFNSDLSSNSVWYTDANGREMQKRK